MAKGNRPRNYVARSSKAEGPKRGNFVNRVVDDDSARSSSDVRIRASTRVGGHPHVESIPPVRPQGGNLRPWQ